MFYLCEKYYKLITAQYSIANCWLSWANFVGLTNWTIECALRTCLYVGDFSYLCCQQCALQFCSSRGRVQFWFPQGICLARLGIARLAGSYGGFIPIIQSEVSQNDKYHILMHIYGI